MAESISVVAGAYTADVAVDSIGGDKFQRVKVALGPDGTYTADADGTAARGLYVDPRPANTRVSVQSAGLTTSVTAYATGDQLGTVLDFANGPRAAGGYATLVQAVLVDEAKVLGPAELYLFDRAVTAAADNAPADFSDADMAFLVGVVDFPLPKQLNSNYTAMGMPLPQVLKANATSIYGYLVTRSAHTFFTAVTNIRVALTFQQD